MHGLSRCVMKYGEKKVGWARFLCPPFFAYGSSCFVPRTVGTKTVPTLLVCLAVVKKSDLQVRCFLSRSSSWLDNA
jgi:hypothetical protein